MFLFRFYRSIVVQGFTLFIIRKLLFDFIKKTKRYQIKNLYLRSVYLESNIKVKAYTYSTAAYAFMWRDRGLVSLHYLRDVFGIGDIVNDHYLY